MHCSFCGTENRPENRFCGICGVRLDRRKAERRVLQDGTHLKCQSCETVNEPGYKFCGTCGSRIERRHGERRGASVSAGGTQKASASESSPAGESSRKEVHQVLLAPDRESDVLPRPSGPPTLFRGEPGHDDRGGILGPSFLGLSDEPESEGDYLLEEEKSSRGGIRRLVLLAILAAILGLVFVQWRSGFSASPKPPEPAHASSPQPQGRTAPSPAATPQQAPDAAPANAGQSPGDQSNLGADAPLVPASAAAAGADSSTDSEALPAAADTPDANSAQGHGASKPLDISVPADEKPSPTLLRAQQYLQGRGVPKNCEQALVYLRAAAQKNEPAAAVQMGALYASGVCVHQDRVMAYRWLNSAHELQPANRWIQKNMDLVWGQMNEQEHRLAAD